MEPTAATPKMIRVAHTARVESLRRERADVRD
jgi:hypothetical protein